jgi:hypothetical protein
MEFAMKLSLLAALTVPLAVLSMPASAGGPVAGPGPGLRPPMHGHLGPAGPWQRPGRHGQAWHRYPGAFGVGAYGGLGSGWWDGNGNGVTVTNAYSIPETQRYEIAPELPVANNIRHAPAGAPVLYVINAPAGAKNARIVEAGPMRPLGPPVIGEGGDQTPRIVELIAR